MPQNESRITVGDLRRMLAAYPDSCEITFGSTGQGGPLIFYRVKDRSGGERHTLVQIELNEQR